jgi:hypothetical protein
VSRAAARARAVVTAGPGAGWAGRMVLAWPPDIASAATCCRCGCPAMTAHVVAAAAGSGPPWLEIADVIVCQGPPGDPRLGAVLRHYPGCAVAAVSLSQEACVAVTRAGAPVRLALGGNRGEPGWGALLCAAFVHGWLSAGQPLAMLDRTRLELAGQASEMGWRDLAHGGMVSVSLAVACAPGTAGPSAACRCLISAASGAPIPA